MCHLNRSEGSSCLSPEKDFGPQVVPDTVEVLLIEQNFADGPVEGAVGQVRHDVLPAKKILTGQRDGDNLVEQSDTVSATNLKLS